jgi:hypothetical protein
MTSLEKHRYDDTPGGVADKILKIMEAQGSLWQLPSLSVMVFPFSCSTGN